MSEQVKQSIDHLINYLITDISSELSIVHFGSSIYDMNKNDLDIDIMLLSENQTFYADIDQRLLTFKSDLLKGSPDCGFKPDLCSDKVQHIENQIMLLNSTEVRYVPALCFGPYKLPAVSQKKETSEYQMQMERRTIFYCKGSWQFFLF